MKTTYLLVFLAANIQLFSQTEFLDSAFNGNGMKKINFPTNYYTWTSRIAIQNNNKILIVTSGEYLNSSKTYELVRLKPGGTLDSTFSSDGRASFNTLKNFLFSEIKNIHLQPDNKIIITATETDGDGNGTDSAVVYRLLPNGTIDSSFGGNSNGHVNLKWNNTQDGGNVLIGSKLLDNGQILVVGNISGFWGSPKDSVVVCRLNVDGSLDTNFHFDGYNAYWSNNITGWRFYYDMTVSPSGSITCLGEVNTNSPGDQMYLVQFDSNGYVNTSFGSNGSTVINISNKNGQAERIFYDNDNNLFITGIYDKDYTNNGIDTDSLFILKLNQNGVIDSSYGQNGVLFINTNIVEMNNTITKFSPSSIMDHRIHTNHWYKEGDDIYVSGFVEANYPINYYDSTKTAIIKTNINYGIDSSFGRNGVVYADLNQQYSIIWSLRGENICIDNAGRLLMNVEFDGTILLARFISSLVLSISDFNEPASYDILIYPNPITSNQIHITLPFETTTQVNVKLFDISGRIIKTYVQTNSSPSEQMMTLDLPELNAGNYILAVETPFKSARVVFIKP